MAAARVAVALVIAASAWQEPACAQSGTWSAAAGTTGSWSVASNWSGNNIANGSGNTAFFRVTGTTTLDSGRTIGTISSGSGMRVIDGPGTLTLATPVGTPTLTGTVNSGTLGISAIVAGTQGFRKTGTSTLALQAANTFSGTALIQTGTAIITNVDALGATGAGNETVVASGAQVQVLTGGSPVTINESFSIAGRGNPTNVAAGNGGAIRILASNVTLAGPITLTGTAELFPNSSSTLTVSGDVSGTGGFILRGSGGLTVSGNMSHTGWVNRWSGGSGVVTLSGSNSYTGSTAVDNGVMTLNNPYAIPSTTNLSVTSGGSLDLNGNDITIRTFGWRDDGVNAPNQNNSTGGVIFDNSATPGTTTITVTSGSFVLGTAINDGGSRQLALNVATADMQNIELTNALSTFSGGLTLMTGPGGGTRLNIQDPLTSGGSAGAITNSIFGTGTVTVGLAPTDRAQFYMGPGTVTAGVGSTVLNDMLFNTAAGVDTPSGVLLNATEAIFAGTLVAGQAPVSFATGSIVTNSVAVLTGRVTSTGTSGGLRLVGNGQVPGITVRLSNQTGTANDYQGPTTIEANTTLSLVAADQVPNGTGKGDVSVDGSFKLGGFSETINGLSGSGSVDGDSGTPTLTLGDGDASATFSGAIGNAAGVLSLVKIGSGMQTLASTNTYSGPTTVQQGTLQLANAAALASSTIVPLAGGTISLVPYLQTTVGGLAPNAGGLVDLSNGLMTVASGLSATDLVTAIVTGRGDGSWTGTSGITSSVAAADVASSIPRAVGWLDNGDGSVTAAYAAPGDTNLDWQVDVLDASNFLSFGKFDSGLAATWLEGDFNYDGVVDVLDAADFFGTGLYDAGNYNTPAGTAGAVAAVPEPSGLALLACVGGIAVAGYRRRPTMDRP
jgi:autotransporter-associated beta strand protein